MRLILLQLDFSEQGRKNQLNLRKDMSNEKPPAFTGVTHFLIEGKGWVTQKPSDADKVLGRAYAVGADGESSLHFVFAEVVKGTLLGKEFTDVPVSEQETVPKESFGRKDLQTTAREKRMDAIIQILMGKQDQKRRREHLVARLGDEAFFKGSGRRSRLS